MSLVAILHAKPKFSDQQIAAMTPQYFKRNHSAPKLTGLKIYTDNGQRIYQVEIQVTRNRSNDDLSFAVSALANICLLYTSPSPRDRTRSRMPSSA